MKRRSLPPEILRGGFLPPLRRKRFFPAFLFREFAKTVRMPKFPFFYIDIKIFSLVKLYELPKEYGQIKNNALLYII